jgi:hypothetical protein
MMKLSSESREMIRRAMLRKLAIQNIWGAKHLSYELLQKGLPKELRGFAKEIAKDLIKEGLLLSHPTSYGLQVSLNPAMADVIKTIVGV